MNDSSHVSSVCSKNASVQNTVHSYAGRRNAQSVVSSRVLCKKKCTLSAFTSLNGKHKHSSLERIIKMRAYCDLQGFTKLIPSKKKKKITVFMENVDSRQNSVIFLKKNLNLCFLSFNLINKKSSGLYSRANLRSLVFMKIDLFRRFYKPC